MVVHCTMYIYFWLNSSQTFWVFRNPKFVQNPVLLMFENSGSKHNEIQVLQRWMEQYKDNMPIGQ